VKCRTSQIVTRGQGENQGLGGSVPTILLVLWNYWSLDARKSDQDQNSRSQDIESLHERIDDILLAAETSRHSSGLNCTVTSPCQADVETKADVSQPGGPRFVPLITSC
jgi:hypothetical protein